MNKLYVSLEQREKLLKMVQFMFPKDNSITIISKKGNREVAITEGISFVTENISIPYKSERLGNNYIAHTFIPWFEFCVGHLLAAILKHNNGSRYYREAVEDFGVKTHNFLIGINNCHPIDFLYEEFTTRFKID